MTALRPRGWPSPVPRPPPPAPAVTDRRVPGLQQEPPPRAQAERWPRPRAVTRRPFTAFPWKRRGLRGPEGAAWTVRSPGFSAAPLRSG